MDIREKLARLNTSHSIASPQPTVENVGEHESWISQLQQDLGVKILREDKSFILLKERYFPLFNEPIFTQLQAEGLDLHQFHKIVGEIPSGSKNLKHAIFIDTETTGLAGGAGTYAFLIGIGHVELDHIVVRQYLLPDFSHEWLMLNHIEQIFQQFHFTVSFNGKSFDIPLLKNRYVLNRMVTVLEDLHHVDLLHAARRIWKFRLPSCDLQTLERQVLNVQREADIPSELIPQIYFEFIRKRDSLMLEEVLEHNYHDIVNMVLLTLKITAICQKPSQYLHHHLDRYTLAKYFYQTKQYRETIPLLEDIISNSDGYDREFLFQTFFLLSMSFKKLGEVDKAKLHLHNLLTQQVLNPFIIEELAKFYEHRDKDYSSAIEIVEKGLEYLESIRQLNPKSDLIKHIPHLKHRHQRLLKKVKVKKNLVSKAGENQNG